MTNWIRWRFRSKAMDDCRPLIFNKNWPWWVTGEGEDFVTIVAFLPEGEDIHKYWDDAYDEEWERYDEILYSDRFPKPKYMDENDTK